MNWTLDDMKRMGVITESIPEFIKEEVHVVHLKHGTSEYGNYPIITASCNGLVFNIVLEENFQYLKTECEKMNHGLRLEWVWDE